MEVWNNRVRGGILFLVFCLCVFFTTFPSSLKSLTHTNCCFRFQLCSSLNLPPSSDPSISVQNSRHRAANMQICPGASAFRFFPRQATTTTIITTHSQFQFIYFQPKKVTENRKIKQNWWARTVIEVVAWHETSDDIESHTSWCVSLCKRRPPLNIL